MPTQITMEHSNDLRVEDTTVKSNTIYSSISSNRHESNLSCYQNYLLYSRCRCPIIYDLRDNRPILQLFGHSDEVNGQQFVLDYECREQSSLYIISTSYDKTAIIWEVYNDPTDDQGIGYRILHSITSLESEYNFLSRCALRKGGKFISVTTSLTGSVYLWLDNHITDIFKASYYCFDSKLHVMKSEGANYILLFLAGSDNVIHVFQISNNKLLHLLDLRGHDDWIKCLDTLQIKTKTCEILLASASQDSYIRVWYIKLVGIDDVDVRQIRTVVSREALDRTDGKGVHKLTATLETVLSGHEGIVHGLCWFKKQPESKILLASCSADKNIVIWKSSLAPDRCEITDGLRKLNLYDSCPATSGAWLEMHRLGETGEMNLPFLGLCISADESSLYALSLRGAIHRWKHVEGDWIPEPAITGHHEPVTDLSWEKSGAYLLSSSLDRTCRIHAIASCDGKWHELARPQVHGHEINCIASLNFSKFASGAEEKTIRAFGATRFFIENFRVLAREVSDVTVSDISEFPVHAQLPALGLSNRGSQCPYEIVDPNDKSGSASNAWYGMSKLVEKLSKSTHLDSLPSEEILLQSTLWWETNKLFGHCNELHALASDSSGSFLASASKANRPDLAEIYVWECKGFRKAATIAHHSLTITRLRFSPNDKYLLSVSRDRTWSLSERTGLLRPAYKKVAGTTKSSATHERIIWDCAWTKDSSHFMTVSRDKKAILWSIDNVLQQTLAEKGEQTASLNYRVLRQFEKSIQSVDCGSYRFSSDLNLFALGFEDGSLELHLVSSSSDKWQIMHTFTRLHQLTIRRLAFQPIGPESEEEEDSSGSIMLLASASDDCVVKLTEFSLSRPRFLSSER